MHALTRLSECGHYHELSMSVYSGLNYGRKIALASMVVWQHGCVFINLVSSTVELCKYVPDCISKTGEGAYSQIMIFLCDNH